MLDWHGATVTVVGAARSGVAAARLLRRLGAHVTLLDRHNTPELSRWAGLLEEEGVGIRIGPAYQSEFQGMDVIIISPGVPTTLDALLHAQARGIPVLGELELASRFLPVPHISVTGTNGKSTTVTLIGRILAQSGKRAFVGGNLGTPLSEAALAMVAGAGSDPSGPPPYDLVVSEVSSFQLETVDGFHPWIAVMLNITPDHLDRYESFDEYVATKSRIFEHQTDRDFVVGNWDDARIKALLPQGGPTICGFCQAGPLPSHLYGGAFLQDDALMVRVEDRTEQIIFCHEVGIQGVHNRANALAASAVGVLCGSPPEAIRTALRSFSGLEYAMEVVRERRGVRYINDSKGTNVDATLKALESLSQPIVLIAGGRDKGGEFSLLREVITRRVKQLIVMGEAASRIQDSLKGFDHLHVASDVPEAVGVASLLAAPGDVVLFSPACASFDLYVDYRERGKHFTELVQALAE